MKHHGGGRFLNGTEMIQINPDGIVEIGLMSFIVIKNRSNQLVPNTVGIVAVSDIKKNFVDAKLIVIDNMVMKGMGHGSQKGSFSLIITAPEISYFFVTVSYTNEKTGSRVFLLQGFQHTCGHKMCIRDRY